MTRSTGGSILVMILVGCAPEVESGATRTTYSVRGVVMQISPEENMVVIHHEAIRDFIGADGRIESMPAHQMEFPLAAGVSLEGVKLSQKVQIMFEVWWAPDPGYELTELRPLDPETPLELGTAPHQHH